MRPTKLPPIPYLLSGMIQPRKPRKFPEDEREILSEKELAALPLEQRKHEVGFQGVPCLLVDDVLFGAAASEEMLCNNARSQ